MTLRQALLVDALGLKLLVGKPPHHGKVSFIERVLLVYAALSFVIVRLVQLKRKM